MSKTMATITVDESDRLVKQLLYPMETSVVTRHSRRNHLMALLMLDAGLRCGEVVQLLQSDLYVGGEPVTSLRVRAEIAKRNHERIIPLSRRIREAIDKMFHRVWVHSFGHKNIHAFYVISSTNHLSRRQLQRIIKLSSFIAFGRQINPHILRHTFASRLMRTCNVRIVQVLLGHKYLSTTQIYTHPNHDDLTDAIKSLE